MGGCCGFSAEVLLEKMESSCKIALPVMVSDGHSRGFLFICINAAVKYFRVAIIMSKAVGVGVVSLWGNQETLCPIRTELVAGIQI